jgi:hypothetical protein
VSDFAPADQPAVTAATHECILAIALDRLTRTAEWDGYARALLDEYLRLRAQDIGRRIITCADNESYPARPGAGEHNR